MLIFDSPNLKQLAIQQDCFLLKAHIIVLIVCIDCIVKLTKSDVKQCRDKNINDNNCEISRHCTTRIGFKLRHLLDRYSKQSTMSCSLPTCELEFTILLPDSYNTEKNY